MATKDLVGQTFSRTLSLHIKDGEKNYLDRHMKKLRRSDHFPRGIQQEGGFFLFSGRKKKPYFDRGLLERRLWEPYQIKLMEGYSQ